MKLQRNLNPVQICLVSSLKVNHVSDGLGSADVDVEGVDDGLSEVFFQGFTSQS